MSWWVHVLNLQNLSAIHTQKYYCLLRGHRNICKTHLVSGMTRTHQCFLLRWDQPTHKTCQSILIFSAAFLMQKNFLWPSLSQAWGAGTGWGDSYRSLVTGMSPCTESMQCFQECSQCTEHMGYFWTCKSGYLSHRRHPHCMLGEILRFTSCELLGFWIKTGSKQRKPQIPARLHIMGETAKRLQESRDVLPSHTFCKKLPLQNQELQMLST